MRAHLPGGVDGVLDLAVAPPTWTVSLVTLLWQDSEPTRRLLTTSYRPSSSRELSGVVLSVKKKQKDMQ